MTKDSYYWWCINGQFIWMLLGTVVGSILWIESEWDRVWDWVRGGGVWRACARVAGVGHKASISVSAAPPRARTHTHKLVHFAWEWCRLWATTQRPLRSDIWTRRTWVFVIFSGFRGQWSFTLGYKSQTSPTDCCCYTFSCFCFHFALKNYNAIYI